MQRGLIGHRAAEKRIAVLLRRDRQSPNQSVQSGLKWLLSLI